MFQPALQSDVRSTTTQYTCWGQDRIRVLIGNGQTRAAYVSLESATGRHEHITNLHQQQYVHEHRGGDRLTILLLYNIAA